MRGYQISKTFFTHKSLVILPDRIKKKKGEFSAPDQLKTRKLIAIATAHFFKHRLKSVY